MVVGNFFGESVQGASHKRSGTECQDSYEVRELSNDSVILAVADGHGSKACLHSKSGSRIAVKTFCDIAEKIYNDNDGNPDKLMKILGREGDTKVAQAIEKLWKEKVRKAHKRNKREKETEDIYTLYGTTLLGVLITPLFIFAYQLGDGDITYTDGIVVNPVLTGEKFLGTDTYSMSAPDSWKQAVSRLIGTDLKIYPHSYMLSTDGFANSYKNDEEFLGTCKDYFDMINTHGADAVRSNLKKWLAETSKFGCGDDITLLIAHFSESGG